MEGYRQADLAQDKPVGCPICRGPGGKLQTVALERAFPVGRPFALKIEVRTLGCKACGFVRDEVAVTRTFQVASCRAVALSGLVNADTFRLLRQVAKLSTTQAGHLLLLDPGTLSRWENGHRACDQRAWVVLAFAAFDALEVRAPPVRLILEAIRAPKPLGVVRVTV